MKLLKLLNSSKVQKFKIEIVNSAIQKSLHSKRLYQKKTFHIYHQTHENKVSEKVAPVPIVDANLMGFPRN